MEILIALQFSEALNESKGEFHVALTELLQKDPEAMAFYRSLHPSVRSAVDQRAEDLALSEDLYALANNAMTEVLQAYGGIYDDSTNPPG